MFSVINSMDRDLSKNSSVYKETIEFHENLQNKINQGFQVSVLIYKNADGTYNIYFMGSGSYSLHIEYDMIKYGEEYLLNNFNRYPRQDFYRMEKVSPSSMGPIFTLYREKFSPEDISQNYISGKHYYIKRWDEEDENPLRVSVLFDKDILPSAVIRENEEYVRRNRGDVNINELRERYSTTPESFFYNMLVRPIIERQIEQKMSAACLPLTNTPKVLEKGSSYPVSKYN